MEKLEAWLESLAFNHKPDFEECRAYLASYFPLLDKFSSTEQDHIWHAEGNVAIHTDMVLKELYTLLSCEAAHITGIKRQALILSALLHDIAKPLTTRTKDIAGNERVVASKHEEVGANYLATRLIVLPLCHNVIMAVIGLVGFHQMPKLLVIKNNGFSDYFKLSLNADLELLYWLEMADMKGRICSDLAKQVDLLEQYKMFVEDYGLWSIEDVTKHQLKCIQVKSDDSQQIFLNSYAIKQLSRGDINYAEEAIAKNYESCQQYGHLYVMCGISGSGKSTWVAKNLAGFEVISLDEIRVELNGKRECQKSRGQVLQLAKARLKKALAAKKNVVWDATNLRKDFRRAIFELGENYGALVTFVVFQLDESTIRVGNSNRRFAIDNEIITKQIRSFEWPWLTETHRMVIVGNNGQVLFKLGHFK